MKNTKFPGLIAILAVIVFSMTACEDPAGSPKDKNLSGTINITPSPTVTTGTELTAVYSGSEGVSYQWNKNGTAINGATSSKFTPTEAGSYTVTVSATGYNSKTSVLVTVTGATLATLGGDVSIISPNTDVSVNTELTASYSGAEEVSFQWKKNGENIEGATSGTYTPTTAGSYSVTVSAAGYAPKTSDPVTVSASSSGGELLDLSGTVSISAEGGSFTINTKLTANYSGEEDVSYQWEKDGEAIDGATSGTYTPATMGSYTVTVSAAGYKSKTSAPAVDVGKADPSVTWPTGLTAAFGETLSAVSLPGNGTSTPAGTFTWTTPSTSVGALGVQSHNMTFTPTDAANYNPLTHNVSITVNKANPTVTWPTAAAITYGAALSTSALTGGSGEGTFAWTNGAVIPTVTNSEYEVTFTPTDTANYNTVKGDVNIRVLLGVEMVSVSGGSFQMGKDLGTAATEDIYNAHQVTLTQGFYIGKYEVTQGQWQAVMGTTIEQQQALATIPSTTNYGRGDSYPVYYVSWYDALVFCNKLSLAEGLTPAYSIDGKTNPDDWGTVPTSSNETWNAATIDSNANGYRLPTEAQWEYAAKGGDPTAAEWVGYTYSGSDTVGDVAWYTDNSGSATHEVGEKAPNGLGIYDMSGNVSEWCWDWANSYTSTAQTDPVGASWGISRVVRGGSWVHWFMSVRSAERNNDAPGGRYSSNGFRLVRSYSEE